MVALASSITLALAGLVGLGLAPAASADTAPACPADTATVTWVLEGNLCVATEHTPAVVDTIVTQWYCPAGYAPKNGSWSQGTTTKPPANSCVKSGEEVQWFCENGYAPNGWTAGTTTRPTGDKQCQKTVQEHVYADPTGSRTSCNPASHDGKTYVPGDASADKPDTTKCYYYSNYDNKWKTTNNASVVVTPTCAAGYSPVTQGPNAGKCESNDRQSVLKYDTAKSRTVCLTLGAQATGDVDVACTCPDFTEDPVSTTTTTWMCPKGYSSTSEVITQRTDCTRPGVDETATCPVAGDVLTDGTCVTPIVPVPGPGPAPAAVDFCPNLDGFQWENYDCNTPQAVAAEVVTPVEPAVVAPVEPAVVAAPEAATVAEPEAATVAAPAAATVPAVIPAGDGSQAPTVPMWALAMIIVGVLGAALTSAKLVGARR